MTSVNPPSEFFEVSRELGASPVFVQGAGGNLSWKYGEVMYVKASGYFLKDLKEKSGYVACRFRPLADFISKVCYTSRSTEQENEFNGFIESHMIPAESFGAPSIETGMHAILGKAVIHTHNVYANVLGCMREGEKILSELFPGSVSISYVNPGLALARALYEAQNAKALPPIIFLLNHGLITQAESSREACELMYAANDVLEHYVTQKGAEEFEVKKTAYDFKKHLFPDSVVYSGINFSELDAKKQRVFDEVSSMSQYVLDGISAMGSEPNYISDDNIRFIANMDKEKHRQSLLMHGKSEADSSD